MYKLADLPAVRAQLERDCAAVNEDAASPDNRAAAGRSAPAAGLTYPAKRLVLENGSYRVAEHGE